MASNKTPTRTIRVNTQLWEAAKSKAASENRTLTAVIMEFLLDYAGSGL